MKKELKFHMYSIRTKREIKSKEGIFFLIFSSLVWFEKKERRNQQNIVLGTITFFSNLSHTLNRAIKFYLESGFSGERKTENCSESFVSNKSK